MALAHIDTEKGGMRLDERFFPHGEDFRGNRVHQTHLEGGDASRVVIHAAQTGTACASSATPREAAFPQVKRLRASSVS